MQQIDDLVSVDISQWSRRLPVLNCGDWLVLQLTKNSTRNHVSASTISHISFCRVSHATRTLTLDGRVYRLPQSIGAMPHIYAEHSLTDARMISFKSLVNVAGKIIRIHQPSFESTLLLLTLQDNCERQIDIQLDLK